MMLFRTSKFGDQLVLDFKIESDVTAVVVAITNGTGAVPICILLPHQVYRAKLIDLIEENPDCIAICIYPIRGNSINIEDFSQLRGV